MAARKKLPTDATAISFKIGELNYKIMSGTSRDFLSSKGKEGGWSILDDGATLAVLDALEKQVSRLKPAS